MATLASLLTKETRAQIYARALTLAASLGLTTTSWAAGDSTRSLYHLVSQILSSLEAQVAGFIGSGFLEYATGDWLTILAAQLFNVTRTEATYATSKITLTNGGGGLYSFDAGDVIVKASASGATYTCTSGGTLSPGPATTLIMEVTADLAGSGSNAAIGDIDTMVTGMPGVTVSNYTAAVASDAESDADLRTRCRAKLGMLSPNGPRDAYDFVARTEAYSGTTEVTRTRTIGDATTGDVTVYCAGSSGAITAPALALVQTALEKYAAPLCITPTAVNCTTTAIDVTYTLWVYASVGEDEATIEAAVYDALVAMLAARPIGGDIIAPATTGAVYQSLIASTIRDVYPDHAFRVTVTAPAGDTALAINAVPTIGTVTPTVVIEVTP